jgi:hypothetical protein
MIRFVELLRASSRFGQSDRLWAAGRLEEARILAIDALGLVCKDRALIVDLEPSPYELSLLFGLVRVIVGSSTSVEQRVDATELLAAIFEMWRRMVRRDPGLGKQAPMMSWESWAKSNL